MHAHFDETSFVLRVERTIALAGEGRGAAPAFTLELARTQSLGQETNMKDLTVTVEEFLLGGGLRLQDYSRVAQLRF